MTYIAQKSTAWEESLHAAALMARGHIPLRVRCDHPEERELEDGRLRRCLGRVSPDYDAALTEPDFLRTMALATLAGMREKPLVPPERNITRDDEDLLARLVGGRWDEPVEFLKLRRETAELCRSRPFRRMAVAIYERLIAVELLEQRDLREIYEQEQNHAVAAQAA